MDERTLLDLLMSVYLGDDSAAQDAAALGRFKMFADHYLGEHRTVETRPVDQNIHLRLSNNEECLVHPPVQSESGDMQPSGDVPVTSGTGR